MDMENLFNTIIHKSY